jgi:hypothetical protein
VGKEPGAQTQLNPPEPEGGLSPEADDPKLNAALLRANARVGLSFVPGENTIPLIRLMLDAEYGEPVPVRRGDHGEPEYLDPISNRWTIFDVPGMGIEDFAGAIGALWPIAGEILGGLGGASFLGRLSGQQGGSLTGALIGVPMGAFFGQFFRLGIAREKGLLDVNGEPPDFRSLAFRAADEAAIPAALAEVLMVPAIAWLQRRSTRAIRRLDAVGEPQMGPGGARSKGERRALIEQLEARAESATRLAGEVEEITGLRPTITAGQVSVGGPGALEELTVVERKLSQRTGHVANTLADVYKEQNVAMDLILRKTAEEAGIQQGSPTHDAFTIGKTMRDKFRIDRAKRMRNRDAAVERAEAKASGLVDEVSPESARLGALDFENLGGVVKDEIISPEMRYAQEAITIQHRELNRMWRDPAMGLDPDNIPLFHFASEAEDMLATVQRALLPTLSKPEREMLEGVFEGARREAVPSVGGVTGAGGAFDTQIASIEQINGALSVLSAQLRKVDANVTSNVDIGSLKRIIIALKKDRALAASRNPALAVKIDHVDRFVAQTKDGLDRSLLGDLVRETGGRDQIIDPKVFDTVWNGEQSSVSAVEDLALLLNGRTFRPGGTLALTTEQHASRQAGWHGMRRGIMSDYRRVVVNEKGIVDLGRHKEYLLRHEDKMKHFFSEDEMVEVRKLGGVAKIVKRAEARRDKFMKLYADTFAGEMGAAKDPMDIFSKVWDFSKTAGNVSEASVNNSNLRQVLRWARRFDPDGSVGLERGFREVAHADLVRNITITGSGGKGLVVGKAGKVFPNDPPRLDYKKLETYLSEHSEQMRMLFGDQYVRNMNTLDEMLTLVSRASERTRALEANATPLKWIARAGVGIFTTPGRVMTAGIIVRAKAADQALVHLMTNPEELARLIRMRALPRPSAEFTAVMSGLGVLVLTEPDSWNDIVMPVDPEVFRQQRREGREVGALEANAS